MTNRKAIWADRLLHAALLLAAGAHLAAFLFVALARVAYPYELEWVEGGVADEVLAVLHGQVPYAQPTVHLVAFIYPPVYFYLSAAVAALTGPGYLPLRLISLAATLACFTLIYALVRQGGGRRTAGLLAAALFAATFKIGGTWLVLARVDALFVALYLAGAYALLRAKRGRGYALAGALLALSFLTKQSTLLMAVPLAAYALLADWRRGWLLAASFAGLALAVSLGFQWASHGWYGYYVFSGALGRPYAGSIWLLFWRQNLLQPLALTVLAGLVFLASEWRRARPAGEWRPLAFWLALAAGTGGAAFWVMLHAGAAENNFLPTYAVVAVLGGLGVDRALGWARGRLAARGRRIGPAALLAVAGLGVVQLWQLAYNPFNHVPGPDNRAAGLALVQRLAQVDGEVLVPQHGLVSALAGKSASAHLGAIQAVLDTGGPPAAQFLDDMRAALRARAFAAIVVDGSDFARYFPELEQNYVVAERLPLDGAFYSIDGPRTLPEVMYVPRP